ncbi:hypothetical protein KSNIM_38175 [Kitasatospora sp. DSM 101779]|jgi:hypothetical protein|nr:hypothetical protein [Kitasatospora sp. DSM 101779]
MVLLRGGPSDIPEIHEVETDVIEDRLKIPRGNGYEHFEFTRRFQDVGDVLIPVYRWSYRTAVAE